ncbi:MAG: DUF4406 domain-containing protein [Bacteroidaceae bacterium]|nr:DUF4406 domain-containing protein [Bacteroidaceae bacterium]
MKKIYIAGKVTGLTIEEYQKNFRLATKFVEQQFNTKKVINPILLGGIQYTWEENMKLCIKELMDCDTVVFIPGWESSEGAKLENYIARSLGYNIYELKWSLVSDCFSDIHLIYGKEK